MHTGTAYYVIQQWTSRTKEWRDTYANNIVTFEHALELVRDFYSISKPKAKHRIVEHIIGQIHEI